MFCTIPLSIVRSFSLYTQQCCMSYRFADSLRAGSGRNCSSILILHASCMTYTTAECTVKNSCWWTEELSETCRVLFQKQIWEISASTWFCYKNLLRCTVTWTSKLVLLSAVVYKLVWPTMIYFQKLFIVVKLEKWCAAKMHFVFDGFLTVCSLAVRGKFILPSTAGSVLLVRNLRKQLLEPHKPWPKIPQNNHLSYNRHAASIPQKQL